MSRLWSRAAWLWRVCPVCPAWLWLCCGLVAAWLWLGGPRQRGGGTSADAGRARLQAGLACFTFSMPLDGKTCRMLLLARQNVFDKARPFAEGWEDESQTNNRYLRAGHQP